MERKRNTDEQDHERRKSSKRIIKMALEVGVDTVQIDIHSGPCKKCIVVQGKVFSISGKTPGFPRLTNDVTPPIHDGCRHVLLPVSLSFLEVRGEKKWLQAFSCNDNLVVADIADYTAVRTGKFLGRNSADGEKIAEAFRSSREKKVKRK